MPTKREIHELVDQLPEDEVPTVHRILQVFCADQAWRSLLNAPYDDEPETEEERHAVDQARASFDRGEGIRHEEIRREFGL